MSFYNFAQPTTSSANAELVNIINDNQQFQQIANLEEEIVVFDNAELTNIVNDNLQSDRPNDNFAIEEEMIVEESECIESNYTRLLSMFPNVDSKYIRQICVEPPFEKNEENSLVMLINHLLSYEETVDGAFVSELREEQNETHVEEDSLIEEEENTTMNDHILSEMLEMQYLEAVEEQKRNEQLLNEQLFSEFLQNDKTVIDEKIKILENILPDADPNVLREFVEKNYENDDLLQSFVASNLKNKNYQKRDQYYTKLKIKDKIEEYTTKFDVKKFISQFPEPFEYFENAERKCTNQDQALNFLINRYKFDDKYVEKVYASTNYNLTLADKHLQVVNGVNPDSEFNIEFDNIPLLQEIAFIQNKANIKEHLEIIKEKEEKEMRLLRAQKLLLECQCCYNDLKPTECIECDNNHIFCKRCIIKGTDLAISNNLSSVNCFMGTECSTEFSLNILRNVLPPNTFEVLLNKRQEYEIKAANLNDLVNCPFCPYSMMLEPPIQIFTCKNPECMKISCRQCKRINHLPIKCKDVLDEHTGRLFVEEAMSKELIRYCQKCNTPFVKKDGCNHMTCRCGASMCYICKLPWDTYNHSRCKKNSNVFEQEQVEIKRVEALSKIRKDFPDLKLPDL